VFRRARNVIGQSIFGRPRLAVARGDRAAALASTSTPIRSSSRSGGTKEKHPARGRGTVDSR